MHARIIGFFSFKGGVGKTTTVANLGAILARDFGKRTLVVDANLSGPTLGLHFGFAHPDYTLHDVLEGKVSIHKAIYEHPTGLHLLPASLLSRRVALHKFKQYLHELRPYYDIILVDAPPTVSEESIAALNSVDELFLITTPDYVALSSTLQAVQVAREKKIRISGLIMNKVRGKNYELSFDVLERDTKLPVVSVLYDDETILASLNKAQPAAFLKPRNDTVVEYKKLAAALIGEHYHDSRVGNWLGSLFRKGLSRDEVNRAIVMESHY
ncbi:AAA family ATPase [Candidatus Woesearchaeota archaeon]|nr:AAA family ATPase [Candidatus Woesearchaeota archaeon]